MAEDYSSNARMAAVKEFFLRTGLELLAAEVTVLDQKAARIRAETDPVAGFSYIKNSKSPEEFSRRYEAGLPALINANQIEAQARAQAYSDWAFSSPNPYGNDEISFRQSADKARLRAEKIKNVLQCINKSSSGDISSCQEAM